LKTYASSSSSSNTFIAVPIYRYLILTNEQITSSLPTSPEASPSSPGTTPQKNLILVDVREPAELVSTGIIPSAVSVPLSSQPDALFLSPDEFETRFGYPKPGMDDAKGDMVFYCRAGVRAKTAAALAVQAGYDPDRIGVYEGSWLDWAGRGGKAERWEEE
jgi:rhodanese-related sulfurtransferase